MPTHIGTFGVCPNAPADQKQTPKEPIYSPAKNNFSNICMYKHNCIIFAPRNGKT